MINSIIFINGNSNKINKKGIYNQANKILELPKITAIYLIELIMSMLIISISFTSVIMTTYIINRVPSKKDIKQATQIATNYLNEILGKDFPTTVPCSAENNSDPCNNLNIDGNLKNNCRTTTASRQNYTNICQYNNLINFGAKDIMGIPINGLEEFTIMVEIITSEQAVLDNLSGGSNIDQTQIARIDVTVMKDHMENIKLSAYKSKFL